MASPERWAIGPIVATIPTSASAGSVVNDERALPA